MRKLGMNRLSDVEQMTLTEFHYKRYAQQYKEVDSEYEFHKLAFLIRNAESKINAGTANKPKEEYQFKQFEDFFDYEKQLKAIDQEFKNNEKPIKKEKKRDTPKGLSPAQIALKHNSRK